MLIVSNFTAYAGHKGTVPTYIFYYSSYIKKNQISKPKRSFILPKNCLPVYWAFHVLLYKWKVYSDINQRVYVTYNGLGTYYLQVKTHLCWEVLILALSYSPAPLKSSPKQNFVSNSSLNYFLFLSVDNEFTLTVITRFWEILQKLRYNKIITTLIAIPLFPLYYSNSTLFVWNNHAHQMGLWFQSMSQLSYQKNVSNIGICTQPSIQASIFFDIQKWI